MDRQDKEYEYLRNEIDKCISIIQKTIQVLYVSTTAIIAWAINETNPLVCFAAYGVIWPTYLISIDYNISMLKIGAYLAVFFDEYKWERRLHKINCENIINRHENAYQFPYTFCSLISFIIFFILYDYSALELKDGILITLNILLFLGFNIYVFLQRRNDKVKQIYIDKWNEIKLSEKQS